MGIGMLQKGRKEIPLFLPPTHRPRITPSPPLSLHDGSLFFHSAQIAIKMWDNSSLVSCLRVTHNGTWTRSEIMITSQDPLFVSFFHGMIRVISYIICLSSMTHIPKLNKMANRCLDYTSIRVKKGVYTFATTLSGVLE